MKFSEKIKLFGDDISYKYPALRGFLKPIYHVLFYNRFNKIREKRFNVYANEAMQMFDKCMNDNNITYRLAFGSMLGAVREKGVIKHDADMDTYITIDEDPNRIERFLTSCGFRLTRRFLVEDGKLGREETYEYKDCPIDIYWLFPEGDSFCCSSFFPYGDYPTLTISMKEAGKVQGLHIEVQISNKVKRVKFGDMMLPIPINAEEFLSGYYGENYMIPDPSWSWKTCKKIRLWDDVISTYSGVE